MRDYWKNYKQILLAMMLIFSTFIFGNPEFKKVMEKVLQIL